METKFFPRPEDFRKWLEAHHKIKEVLWVGFHKKATNKASIDWPESVDEALCFGWIDGLRRRIDEEAYMIRFTPRKKNSHWSVVNIKRFKILQKEGRVQPAGLEAFQRRTEKNSKRASYEQSKIQLAPEFEKRLKANKTARKYFSDKAPYYKNQCIHWVMSAKMEKTRERRFCQLLDSCADNKLIPPLRWTEKKKK